MCGIFPVGFSFVMILPDFYKRNKMRYIIDNGNVYIYITDISCYFNKRPNDFLQSPGKISLMKRIEDVVGFKMYISRRSDPLNGGGTWISNLIFIEYAKWLSNDFYIWILLALDKKLDDFSELRKILMPNISTNDKIIYTYIAKDGLGRYKIGKSGDLVKRESSGITTNLDFEIIYFVDRDIESILLDIYKDKKVVNNREWISLTDDELNKMVLLYGFVPIEMY